MPFILVKIINTALLKGSVIEVQYRHRIPFSATIEQSKASSAKYHLRTMLLVIYK